MMSLPRSGLSRRSALANIAAHVAASTALGLGYGTAHAQAVRGTAKIVVGFPPGGGVDIIARRVCEKIAGLYNAGPAVTENKAGAGGRIACETVKNAPGDGLTFLLTPSSIMSVYPVIYKDLRYDPVKDFKPVASAGIIIHSLVVGPAVPASVTNVKQFVEWARANPQSASYGSPAAGSIPHFVGAVLGINAGIDLRHVPYRGSLPGLNDLLGGQLPAMVTPLGDTAPFYQAGKLRILGISSSRRSELAPDVPTFAEQGFDYMTSGGFYGFYLPASTPDVIVQSASAAINQAFNDKAMQDMLLQTGLLYRPLTPDAISTLQREENQYWGPIVKKIGFTGDT